MEMTKVTSDQMSDPFTEYVSKDFEQSPQRQLGSQPHPNLDRREAMYFNNPQQNTPNPFIEDLDRRFPRIAVSPSMLYAYSLIQAKDTVQNDPLHSALYAHPNRSLEDQRRLQLELVSRRHSIQSLPKHTTFFWDPIDQQPRLEIPSVLYDPFKPLPSNVTFKEHLNESPASVGTNHCKGNMVWSNFGYIKIRGRWVDPDGEGEVADAYNAYESGDNEAPYLPDLHKSLDSGPRIMNLEEQDEFYSQYTEEVSDEEDGEGDPRFYRITPATFARWAVGSGTGERYEEKPFIPGPKLPSPDPRDEAAIQSRPRPQLQYDMETGSVLSGFYENDPHPQVLHTPQGVNVVRTPAVYSYSYPQAAIDLDLQAFNNNQTHKPRPSIASTPEVFNSENGIRNIAPELGDFHIGEQMYEDSRHKISNLRTERQYNTAQLFLRADAAKATAEQRIQLGREVFFLKDRLSSMPPPRDISTPPPSTPSPPNLNNNLPTGQFNNSYYPRSPPKPKLRRRTQYQRYLREEIEREETAVNKTKQFQKRIDEEHQEILEEMRELQVTKDQLLGALGVRSVSDLPGLIPKRETSGRDLRAQFGLD
ncbi:hypothetical protein BKA64DRAFT_666481 [Cadophora sp. MPI-SDFR-AT-0126]|nr:hypothetical protein BKA64DRAFT_666481 [Leotiomycetes sp. MPI-SDFR-AT-0126]